MSPRAASFWLTYAFRAVFSGWYRYGVATFGTCMLLSFRFILRESWRVPNRVVRNLWQRDKDIAPFVARTRVARTRRRRKLTSRSFFTRWRWPSCNDAPISDGNFSCRCFLRLVLNAYPLSAHRLLTTCRLCLRFDGLFLRRSLFTHNCFYCSLCLRRATTS